MICQIEQASIDGGFMRRPFFLSTVLAAALGGAVPALAADDGLPPEFRTSHFEVYVGAFGSFNAVSSSYSEIDPADPDLSPSGSLNGSANGFGLRGGTDYVSNGWLVGLVGDWSLGGEIASEGGAGLDMRNLGTVRARAGIEAGNTLLYVTGGYAQAEMEFSINNEDLLVDGSERKWTYGWALGAGADIEITEAVTLGLEYLYVKVGDVEYDIEGEDETLSFEQEIDAIHTFRLGVNYAFQI
jgi:outer membrane immunogenic protein